MQKIENRKIKHEIDNSFFISSNNESEIFIDRFHVCSWQFRNKGALIEFGIEINSKSIIKTDNLQLLLYIPWLKKEHKVQDFYSKLKNSANSKFIFNDAISATSGFDDGSNNTGVVFTFKERGKLCIMPIELNIIAQQVILSIDYKLIAKHKTLIDSANIYIRFGLNLTNNEIVLKKNGINKTTFLYDIKLNEKRNLPDSVRVSNNCHVKACFCFNIVPNDYSINFYENSSLMSVRTLEYNSFNKYIKDDRLKNEDLIVVFQKKEKTDTEFNSFSFFSVYSKEVIGMGQLAIGILLNLFCSLLLFVPINNKNGEFLYPWQFWAASFIWIITIVLFCSSKIFQIMIIFIGGIHGVGKGTICKEISKITKLKHFSSSSILNWKEFSPDASNKRVMSIEQTQERLLKNLFHIKQNNINFILDGHFCLFNNFTSIKQIEVNVFKNINPSIIIVVVDELEKIQQRLLLRDNKIYDLEQLKKMQDIELEHSIQVANQLDIPHFKIQNKKTEDILDLIAKF
ncbi:MAG: ATP-binding protein [Bacteroidota bacterium]